jgi:asparagine synthetase B (glutamine-hydrolysing)
VPITADVIRDGLSDFSQRFNQLAGQSHYLIASAHAVKAAADKGFRHVFTGDGCDGLFLGYPTVHLRAKFIMGLSKIAPVLKGPLRLATRSGWLERRLGHPYRVARNVSNILQREMPTRAHVASCILDSFALEQLRGPAPRQDQVVEDILTDLARGKDGVSPVRLAYQGKSKVGLNKNKLEGAGDLAGVVLMSPFLHPGMASFAAALPEALSRPKEKTKSESTGKYALMQMAERKRHLPLEIIYQPKRSPVTAPVDGWYMGPLREFMLGQLDGLPFHVDAEYAASLVSPKYSEDLFRKYVGLGRFATHAINVLVTHAAFTRLATRPTET